MHHFPEDADVIEENRLPIRNLRAKLAKLTSQNYCNKTV